MGGSRTEIARRLYFLAFFNDAGGNTLQDRMTAASVISYACGPLSKHVYLFSCSLVCSALPAVLFDSWFCNDDTSTANCLGCYHS